MASLISRPHRRISICYAKFWQYYYCSKNWLLAIGLRYKTIFTVVILISLLVLSWLYYPEIKSRLTPYFSTSDRFEGLQTLLVSLGEAMIGATVITFSFIMFAMQVNVERMPHGFFRKFSSDYNLLGYFAVTFLLAIMIACLSLIPDKSWATLAILGASWCLFFLVLFLLFAYKRALSLISPTKQLAILVTDTEKNLEIWSKAAQRVAPFLKRQSQENADNPVPHTDYDTERNKYFLLNQNSTAAAKKEVSHCIAFARRYAEQRDHEVSDAALNSILDINKAYVDVKSKAFFSNSSFIDLASDGFIDDTLEHLRQNVRVGISRGDEQQIEQTFRAVLGLCKIYSNIDYAHEYAKKPHACLAARYLSDAVESVVPHNMADVLMEGIRLMGTAALTILSKKEPEQVASIAEKIAIISCVGASNEKYRPVTQTGVAQLANLAFELITCDSHDVQYPLRDIRENIKLIVKTYLEIPDTTLISMHSASLGAYYSRIAVTSFQNKKLLLANDVLNAEENDENAIRIINHIEQWADGLYQTEKDLLLLAIEKRSSLAHDIIHAINITTKILCMLTNAPACNAHNSDELKRHALRLISVLDLIPDKPEVISFVENHQVTKILFESAMEAHHRGCDELASQIRDLLLKWAFKAGKYQIGWAILERACCDLACLNIELDLNDDVLLQAIEEKVAQGGSPDELKLRFRASEAIREEADRYHDEHPISAIEPAMEHVDQARLRTVLLRVAEKLVPKEIRQEEPQDDN